IVEEGTKDTFWRMVLISLPFIIIVLIIGAVFGTMITRPINQLVTLSKNTITKGNIDESTVRVNSPIYEVKVLNKQIIDHLHILNKQATLDGLTRINNRRTFDNIMNQYIEAKQAFSLILLDIDFFKKVNDRFGHLIGDEVLKFLTEEMKDIIGEDHLCFRYGGEEFAIIVNTNDEDEAFKLAESLRTHIANTVSLSGEQINISLGLTMFRENDIHIKDIVNRADAALYHSKSTGRNK